MFRSFSLVGVSTHQIGVERRLLRQVSFIDFPGKEVPSTRFIERQPFYNKLPVSMFSSKQELRSHFLEDFD